jgi:hypothetical protein
LKADTPKFSTTSIFVNKPKGMEDSVLENVLDVAVDNVEQFLIGSWTGR